MTHTHTHTHIWIHAHAFRFQRNETNPRLESFQTVCNLANASMRLTRDVIGISKDPPPPLWNKEEKGRESRALKRSGKVVSGSRDERVEERGGGDQHEPRHGFSLAATPFPAFNRLAPVCTFFLLLIAPPPSASN